MRNATAIALILGLLLSSGAEFLHACAMTGMSDSPAPAAAAADGDMPCHGAQSSVADEPMDCCGDGADQGHCPDCSCAAMSPPASALESTHPRPGAVTQHHAPPGKASAPPDQPPEYLLRPPIVFSG